MNFIGWLERDRAACPKVETIIGFMNIPGYMFNVSWNFAALSLLSETIKTLEVVLLRILLREEGRETNRDELLERGRSRSRSRIFICARSKLRASLDCIKRIID